MSAEVVDSNPYSRLMALQRMGIVANYERIRDFSVAIVVRIKPFLYVVFLFMMQTLYLTTKISCKTPVYQYSYLFVIEVVLIYVCAYIYIYIYIMDIFIIKYEMLNFTLNLNANF